MHNEKHYNIIIVGTFDCENFGDLLFPITLEQYFKNRSIDVTIYPFSPQECNMPFFEEKHVYSINNMENFIKLHDVDAIIIGGGDLIRLDSQIGKSYLNKTDANLLWAYPIIIGNMLEIPIIFNCPGVPFEFNRHNKKIVKCLMSHIAYLSVRDEYSKQYLLDCGVYNSISVSIDTIVGIEELYPISYVDSVLIKLKKQITLPESEYIVVQINNSIFSEKDLFSLKEFIEHLANETEYELVFMPIGYEHDDDIALERLKKICNCSIHLLDSKNQKLSPEQMIAIIKNAAFFIGTSLHGAVVSYVYNVKFMEIMSGFSTKIYGFCKYICATNCVINISDNLWERFLNINQQEMPGLPKTNVLVDFNNHLNCMLNAIYSKSKRPSGTIITELLELCSDHNLEIKKPKIYLDFGNGYDEEHTKYGNEITQEGIFHLRSDIEDGCIKIRLDPVETSCVVLLSYAVSDKGSLTITDMNGIGMETAYIFCNNDPRIEFKLQKAHWVELEGYVFPFSDHTFTEKINFLAETIGKIAADHHMISAELLSAAIRNFEEEKIALNTSFTKDIEAINKSIKDKDKKIEEITKLMDKKETEIASLNDVVEEKSAIINTLNTAVKSKKEENEVLNAFIQEKEIAILSLKNSVESLESLNKAFESRVCQLENSTCWKITKPIRVIVIVLRKTFSNRTYGRFLKKIYMTIPISIQTKLRIKGVIFKLFSPFIKNTNAYQNWKNYTYPINKKDETCHDIKADKTQEKQFLEQIMNIPYIKNNEEYVSKSSVPIYVSDRSVKYLAFYLPQYHPFPENNEWWGTGFTEWTNVTKAVPQFVGHNQPRLAGELGYYDLRNKEIILQQMNLAKQYGIYGFCIYYYWFDGKRLMDTPLNFIMDNAELNLPFCLCWANENWSRKWDGKNQDILIAQNYNPAFPDKFIKDVIPYMQDSRYITFCGKPVLIIYNANEIPALKHTIDYWRDYCRKCGIGEIHLLAVDFALNTISKQAGFDGFVEFPPHSVYNYSMEPINSHLAVIDSTYAGNIFDYGQIVREKRYLGTNLDKYYKGIFLGWDNTARRPKNATVYHNFTISAFKEWLTDISRITMKNHDIDDRFVFINAWNEWAEGTYLEPDRQYGHAALEAVRQVLLSQTSSRKGIIYVSHDACYNGAQLLSLNIIEQLSKVYKYNVFVILINGGVLIDKFKQLASDFICLEEQIDSSNSLIRWLENTQCNKAMCNTVITGDVLKLLSEHGVHCISMIHEMEQVIKQYHSENKLENIAKYADKIVYASNYVRKSADRICKVPDEKVIIIPQGNYKANKYGVHNHETRLMVRKKLGLSEDVQIILGVGFGDERKGIDLFIKTAIRTCAQNLLATFVWVGEVDQSKKADLDHMLYECSCKDRIIFAGPTDDVFLFYSAADLFVLTSREDPFPTVVMEAMEAGLPVVAFKDGGGYVEIVTPETGVLVEMENWTSMAEEIIFLLNDKYRHDELGKNAHNYIEKNFNFLGYVHSLLDLLGEKYCRVTAVIPNYNYEKYLQERIESVLLQDYPVYEVILLDDVSSDNSIEMMEQYVDQNPLQIKLVKNKQNSGNVFNQWEKGCNLATGEYIWIAEADDLSKPTFLSRIMDKMSSDSSIVLGYSQSYMIDENGKITAENYFCYTDDVDDQIWKNDYVRDSKDEITKRMSAKNTIPNVSAVVLKNRNFDNMFKAAKKFRVAGDWAFYISLLECGGKVAFIAESLNYHRRHSNSVTTDLNAKTHFEEICQMQDYIISSYKDEVDIDKIMVYRKNVKTILGVKD